ncbi:MAG: glycosyltransferase family 4 protein [Candidatus Omnitrophica bacterium]|nr:glycosyltransferase family 4 protein [Candidatus Omnitrophota bacterium]
MSDAVRRLRLMLVISSSELGGAERVVQLLCRSLDVERFAPAVVCPPSAAMERIAGERGMAYWPLAFPVPVRWRAVRQLARLIREHRPDIIHTHLILADLYGMLACRIARGPVWVSTIHGPNYLLPWGSPLERAQRWCLGWFYRALYQACDGVATCSEAVKQAVSSGLGIRVAPSKTTVIHNGIALQPFSAALNGASRRAARPTVVCVSNFAPFKGHEVLVEALRRLTSPNPVRCLMVGDGPTRGRIERAVQAAGLSQAVEFLGFRDDVPAILREADAVVLPSHWEPFGLVILEAMAAGVPVVATAAGGVPEIVTDGETGLLVPPGDARAMAQAVARVLSEEPLRQRLVAQAAELVRTRFTAEAMARAYERWYEHLAAVRGVAGRWTADGRHAHHEVAPMESAHVG